MLSLIILRPSFVATPRHKGGAMSEPEKVQPETKEKFWIWKNETIWNLKYKVHFKGLFKG